MTPLLVLVGAPGAGKSTIGRLVAHARHVAFRDTDTDVEERAGIPIAEIFVDQGEEAFRALERSAVETALREHDGVLALGGGAVLDARTRELLQDHRVVFLDVGLADAAQRCGLNRDRPLLLVNPRATLAKLLEERRPFYEEVATVTVDTAGRAPEEIAAEVLEVLG